MIDEAGSEVVEVSDKAKGGVVVGEAESSSAGEDEGGVVVGGDSQEAEGAVVCFRQNAESSVADEAEGGASDGEANEAESGVARRRGRRDRRRC